MQGLATVFGGSGFIGRYVVRALAKRGWRVRAAVRDPNLSPELRVMGDVGQIELVQANVRMPDSVDRALEGATACVNLVGVLYESGRQGFGVLHGTAPGTIAAAAARRGISRMVQVSAIGADPSSPSSYGRTKAEGEAAARAALKSVVIMRPSIVFGPEDHFFNRFAAMAAMSPALPLIGGGHTRFQPVYAGDVASAIVAALEDPTAAGRSYELGGPAVYSFRELIALILKETCHKRALVPIPWGVAGVMGAVAGLAAFTPIPPMLTRDQVASLRVDNVADPRAPGLVQLGVTPTAVEASIPTYLWRFRKGGQFAQPEAASA